MLMPDALVLANIIIAGWSSPVARQAHNLKVAGSNAASRQKFCRFAQQMMQVQGRAATPD